MKRTVRSRWWLVCGVTGVLAVAAPALAVVVVPGDYATLQEAVNAVQSDTSPGEVVIDSDAVFSESLLITASVILRAGTGFAPVIEPGSGTFPFPPIRIQTPGDVPSLVRLEGLRIQTTGPDAVQIANDSMVGGLIVQIVRSVIDTTYGDGVVVASTAPSASVSVLVTNSLLDAESLGGGTSCVRIAAADYNVNVIVRDSHLRFSAASGIYVRPGHDGRTVSVFADRNLFEGVPSASFVGGGVIVSSTGVAGAFASTTSTSVTNSLFVGGDAALTVNAQQQDVHTVLFNNNTVVGSGYSALFLSTYSSSAIDATVYNNIIVGSGANGDEDLGHGLTVEVFQSAVLDLDMDFNLWFDNALGDVAGGVTLGASSLTFDPQFRDGPGGDYHLVPTSPAVDSGESAPPGGFGSGLDLEGGPRVVDGDGGGGPAVDRGALEYGWIFVDGFESGDLSSWSSASV